MEGVIVDREGKATTDPNDFYDGGALAPFGGHKGYAIALFAEVPDAWTVTGMAIIALSSAYIARREAQIRVVAISSERL